MKSHISLADGDISEVFLRILPRYLRSDTKELLFDASYFRIFLERGLQVMGKSTMIKTPESGKNTPFGSEDKFDFQVLNEKNLEYAFVLYVIDEVGNEERIQSITYNALKHYKTFVKQGKNQFPQQIYFPNHNVTIQIIVLFNSVLQTINQQTSRLLALHFPEKSDEKLQNQKFPTLKIISPKRDQQNPVSFIPQQIREPILQEGMKKQRVSKPPQFLTPEKRTKKSNLQSEKDEQMTQNENGGFKKISLIFIILLIILGVIGGTMLSGSGKKVKKKSKTKKIKLL